jgi:hypothetical protein
MARNIRYGLALFAAIAIFSGCSGGTDDLKDIKAAFMASCGSEGAAVDGCECVWDRLAKDLTQEELQAIERRAWVSDALPKDFEGLVAKCGARRT